MNSTCLNGYTDDRCGTRSSRDTSKTGMSRSPLCHSVLLRSFTSPRPVFSHGRRFYAQFKMDKTAEDFNELSMDEQLERLTNLNASADNNPDVDFWSLNSDLLGQSVRMIPVVLGFRPITFGSLDLHIPAPVIRSMNTPLSLKTRVNNFFANQANHLKNIFRLVQGCYMIPTVSHC